MKYYYLTGRYSSSEDLAPVAGPLLHRLPLRYFTKWLGVHCTGITHWWRVSRLILV